MAKSSHKFEEAICHQHVGVGNIVPVDIPCVVLVATTNKGVAVILSQTDRFSSCTVLQWEVRFYVRHHLKIILFSFIISGNVGDLQIDLAPTWCATVRI